MKKKHLGLKNPNGLNVKTLLLSIVIFTMLVIYLYQELRPTIIFHTYSESGFLGKVSTIEGHIDKLFINNHRAKYKLPHIWNWNKEDEVAIFTKNYWDLFKKEDVNFWKLDIFLDEDGYYAKHYEVKYPF